MFRHKIFVNAIVQVYHMQPKTLSAGGIWDSHVFDLKILDLRKIWQYHRQIGNPIDLNDFG